MAWRGKLTFPRSLNSGCDRPETRLIAPNAQLSLILCHSGSALDVTKTRQSKSMFILDNNLNLFCESENVSHSSVSDSAIP